MLACQAPAAHSTLLAATFCAKPTRVSVAARDAEQATWSANSNSLFDAPGSARSVLIVLFDAWQARRRAAQPPCSGGTSLLEDELEQPEEETPEESADESPGELGARDLVADFFPRDFPEEAADGEASPLADADLGLRDLAGDLGRLVLARLLDDAALALRRLALRRSVA